MALGGYSGLVPLGLSILIRAMTNDGYRKSDARFGSWLQRPLWAVIFGERRKPRVLLGLQSVVA